MRLLTLCLAAAGLLSLAGPAAAADPKASRYYEDALARFEKKDFPGAVIQLKNALQIDQQMLAAHMLLGKALLSSGDPVGAEVEFDLALKLGVNRVEVVTLLGRAYMLQGKYDAVLERITSGGLPVPLQVEVLLLRANAESGKGNLLAAARTLDEARALDAHSVPVRLAQATIAIRGGDLARAGAATDEAIGLAPNDAGAWNTRGSILHLKGDLAGALAAYAKAAALDPTYLDPRVTRAGLLVDLGRTEEAGKEVEGVLAIEPREPRAAYLKAVLAAGRGDTATVKAALTGITQLLDPVDPGLLAVNKQMLLLVGLAHYGLGDQEKAVDRLSTYLRHFPSEPGPTKILASLYLDRGDRTRAVSLLEPILRAVPNDPRTLSLLATAYMQQGNYRQASTLLEQAVRLSGAADMRTDLGLSLVGAGKAEMGIEQLQQVFAKDPRQARAGIALTTLHLGRGQPKRALQVVETLVRSDPENLTALNLLGIARVASGDRAGGRKAYEQVLARDPGYQGATLNLARLDTAEGKPDAARQRLARMVQADPHHVEAMVELAALEEKAGKSAEAERWLEKAREEPKGSLRAGLLLADLHLRAGNTEQALAVAKETLAKASDNLAALAMLARAQVSRGDLRGARQTLGDMTRYANYDPAAQFEVARLQMAAGNDAGAAYSLDKALGSQPDFLPALVLYAEIEIRRRDFPKAEQRIRLVAEKNPAGAVAMRLQGDLAMAKGQFPAALASYGAALKRENSGAMALRAFRAHVGTDELARGVAFLERWHREHPDDREVLRTIADGHLRGGNLGAARSAYERLLKANPDDAEVLNNLAQTAQQQHDKAALGFAERAYALRRNDPLLIDTLGWILVRQGQLERGVALLRDARLRDPANPEVRYHLAAALAKNGRYTEARDELAQALKAGSSFDGIDEARQLQRELARQP